ncbi:MAG TPA: hypothetical protein VHE33_17055, partial [Acidobacteriaceae bacterium]|nr:hypothetical protein [Acidobacteriaceae bacterium]
MARSLPGRLLLASLALGVAGCGSINYAAQAGDGSFALRASATSVATNGQVALQAVLPSGESAPVAWQIASGTNAASLGQGHIDANGIYTAPGSLSADSIAVRLEATLSNEAKSTASLAVTVHPGFVQPLLPQNVALTPGATAEVTAQIAEVDSGSVSWRLAATPTGPENAALGTLSGSECRRSSGRYTSCSVLYTAPSALPAGSVYVVAAVNGTLTTAPLRVLLNNQGIVSNPVTNQALQQGAILLGGSGGNDGDFDTYEDHDGAPFIADCCGGTLGALVEDQSGDQYILSNNHVLAESDQGHIGDTIDQPGLIDGACTPLTRPGSTLRPVGTLESFVPLASKQTNVDAA